MLEMVKIQKNHRQRRAKPLLGQADGAFCALRQQCPIGQTGKRVVVGEPVNAFLVRFAVADFAVQAVHGVAQFTRAVLHLLLKSLVCHGKRCLCLLAFGDIHGDPDRALGRVVRVKGFAAHLAHHGRAVLAAHFHLPLEGLTSSQHWIAPSANVFPHRITGIPAPGWALDQFTGGVSQHLLEMAVATRKVPVTKKNNTDHGMVEQQLFFS